MQLGSLVLAFFVCSSAALSPRHARREANAPTPEELQKAADRQSEKVQHDYNDAMDRLRLYARPRWRDYLNEGQVDSALGQLANTYGMGCVGEKESTTMTCKPRLETPNGRHLHQIYNLTVTVELLLMYFAGTSSTIYAYFGDKDIVHDEDLKQLTPIFSNPQMGATETVDIPLAQVFGTKYIQLADLKRLKIVQSPAQNDWFKIHSIKLKAIHASSRMPLVNNQYEFFPGGLLGSYREENGKQAKYNVEWSGELNWDSWQQTFDSKRMDEDLERQSEADGRERTWLEKHDKYMSDVKHTGSPRWEHLIRDAKLEKAIEELSSKYRIDCDGTDSGMDCKPKVESAVVGRNWHQFTNMTIDATIQNWPTAGTDSKIYAYFGDKAFIHDGDMDQLVPLFDAPSMGKTVRVDVKVPLVFGTDKPDLLALRTFKIVQSPAADDDFSIGGITFRVTHAASGMKMVNTQYNVFPDWLGTEVMEHGKQAKYNIEWTGALDWDQWHTKFGGGRSQEEFQRVEDALNEAQYPWQWAPWDSMRNRMREISRKSKGAA
ncbi:hypothetical protein DCS_03210 [Drechmeria coniospora]|uniref:Uncharacterized protein n=1 Tax=Drechmeria coniospora TaxID=98403 RepID=A0A151GYA0_DRECN|nr:hypothetical protein DCS_03210 [Drechmeria coniospora]KYK62065.1 hypothetical protein DCS_03210 [Drechmeria coniospora]